MGHIAEKPFILVFGYVVMFITGISLYTGIEYQTGSIIYENSSNTVVENVYSQYRNTQLGVMFSLMWALMFVLTLMEFKPKNEFS